MTVVKLSVTTTSMGIKRRKARMSWHQKQLRTIAIVLAILAMIAFGVGMYLMNSMGANH